MSCEMKSNGTITIVIDGENAKVNSEGKINIKEGSIGLGKTLGILLKGYDEDVLVKAAQVFTEALAEQYEQEKESEHEENEN